VLILDATTRRRKADVDGGSFRRQRLLWPWQAVWIDRYFIFIAAAYMILIAVAVNRLQPAWIRNLWIAVIVTWSVVAGITDLRTNRIAWSSPLLGSRIPWGDIARVPTLLEKLLCNKLDFMVSTRRY
jgi:hypothetical protein